MERWRLTLVHRCLLLWTICFPQHSLPVHWCATSYDLAMAGREGKVKWGATAHAAEWGCAFRNSVHWQRGTNRFRLMNDESVVG
jgi:hypothetical protein